MTKSAYRSASTALGALEAAGEQVDRRIWTDMLQFKRTSALSEYIIDLYDASASFPAGQKCYGKASLDTPHFEAISMDLVVFPGMEDRARQYAVDASEMLRVPFSASR